MLYAGTEQVEGKERLEEHSTCHRSTTSSINEGSMDRAHRALLQLVAKKRDRGLPERSIAEALGAAKMLEAILGMAVGGGNHEHQKCAPSTLQCAGTSVASTQPPPLGASTKGTPCSASTRTTSGLMRATPLALCRPLPVM